jgi:hypothetical protein
MSKVQSPKLYVKKTMSKALCQKLIAQRSMAKAHSPNLYVKSSKPKALYQEQKRFV